MDQAVAEFLVESREGLTRFEHDVLAMEAGTGLAPDRIAAMFRVVHTIKGTAGFLGLPRLEALVHQGEAALGLLRDGRLAPGPAVVGPLLTMLDVLRRLLAEVEATGREGSVDPSAAIEALRRLQAGGAAAPTVEAAADPGPLHEVEGSVRIDVRLLDSLMDLVGELVLVRNQALRLVGEARESDLLAPVQRLDLVATELQQRVMKTRMQPIGVVWTKLPRVVRDLAVTCGKRVRLELEGSATELDRTILEAVKDPLLHLVRNAVDHGIEAPAARAAAGKPAEGKVVLRAHHEGGNVVVEVADDGAGIDWRRVADAGLRAGAIAPEQAARLDPAELSALLFRPGLSTAERVTTVSGRGVGLDVVKVNVERLGGAVRVESARGAGTKVRVEIPLTLAIIPALVVTGRGQRYAIPQVNVLELVRLEERSRLERVLDAQVLRLRGKLLTLLDLDRELAAADEAWSPPAGPAHVVVVRAEERTFGLVVDDVIDTEEIVVKPLPRQVKEVGAFAGATIMGDGRVALILDAAGLARRASLQLRAGAGRPEGEARRAAEAREPLLLVEVCGGERAAILLADVARIEDVEAARLERSGGDEVVQYRGSVLPIVRLSRLLGRPEAARAGDVLPVIVHAGPAGSVGLAVERVVDIVEEALPAARRSPRPGVACTAVVQQRVTDLLDVPALLAAAGRSA